MKMLKSLSKSTWMMFLFDLMLFVFSTVITGKYLGLSARLIFVTTLFMAIVGFSTNYLKENYKIRSFRTTLCNSYRMLEGMILAHIPAGLLLYLFVH